MYNILICSIGTRGYLIDHFKESLGPHYGIYACDASKYAPGLQKADKSFVVPLASDSTYSDELLKICLVNNISILLSINDLELNYLSKLKQVFAKHGITIVISSEEVISIAFDKHETYKFCKNNDIPVPLTYKYNEINEIHKALSQNKLLFPLIAKPRRGSRSIGIQLINNLVQLDFFLNFIQNDGVQENEKHLIQEYVLSDKYSIHIFNDINGNPETVIVMVNIFRNLGETFHIKTISDPRLIALGYDIGKKLRHIGPLGVDVQMKDDGSYVVLEFNPRFSGCYSLSHFAGADFPKRIINLHKNRTFEVDNNYTTDLIMLKQFTTSYFTEQDIDNKVQVRKED